MEDSQVIYFKRFQIGTKFYAFIFGVFKKKDKKVVFRAQK